MSKRVSASATALPTDGSDLSHPSNLRDVCAAAKNAVAQSKSSNARPKSDLAVKGTDFVPLTVMGNPIAPTRATAARVDSALHDEAPQRGASETTGKSGGLAEASTKSACPVLSKGRATEVGISISGSRSTVERVAPRHTANEAKRRDFPALRAKSSAKSASPKRAKAHLPRGTALILCETGIRPKSILPELPEVYAMGTDGDCMMPEILNGQKILVLKGEEIRRGDTVCIWLRNPTHPKGYSALVKKMAMLPPPHVQFPYEEHPESEVQALFFVEQINPPRTYRIPCEQVLALHKVIGVQKGRG